MFAEWELAPGGQINEHALTLPENDQHWATYTARTGPVRE
jgi:hypothetical protein